MSRLATMPPGYFALVMATGIVSIASSFLGFRELGLALLWLNVVQYLALIGFTILRFIRYRPEFVADLVNESKVVTFLTASAGTFILGSQFVILLQMDGVGTALWIVGIVLWIAFVSAFFTTVITRGNKPTVAEGITGATLILIVATEGICVLGTLLAAAAGSKERILFVCLAAYAVGAILYLIFITLILFRWMFFSLDAGTLTPSYWINMGALAITTLAGSRLILSADRMAVSARDCRLCEGRDVLLLGDGGVVDSSPDHCWLMAPWRSKGADSLRPAILVVGVSLGDVHGRDDHV